MMASTKNYMFEPIDLPNGQRVKNRIAKAAMEEYMPDIKAGSSPSKELIKLYEALGMWRRRSHHQRQRHDFSR